MSVRFRLLALPAGIAAIVLGLALGHARYVDGLPLGGQRLGWSMAFIAALAVASYSLGLPDVPVRARQIVSASIGAALAGAVVISLAQLAVGVPLLPRFVVLGAMILVPLWAAAVSAAIRAEQHWARPRDRVVLVGVGEDTTEVPGSLLRGAEVAADVVAIVEPRDAARGATAVAPLIDICRTRGADVLVLDRTAQADQSIVDQAALLHESGVRVRTLSLFYDAWLGRLPVGELERISLMFDIGELHRKRFARRKRLMDIGVALVGLPALAVAVPIIGLGNLIGNRGPLFFRQERVGKGGEVFSILKFRTMRPAASPSDWTSEHDQRVTRFGRLLRRTHLDELPQVINILRGELSLVGPRPEQVRYVDELSAKLPFYDLRHLVQPGLTGWAQVNQGYAASADDALLKLQYEFWYLRHQRLAVDLRIVARTLRSVLGGDGR